ncbi:hypothetical protein KSS87_016478 [Heliosperma pusillum]|nr:hypothetical protein KSS87_009738 [Heliosperma pusillum]KAH9622921.1 hypothetical protein KSS87_016478 [Heliosperma pusillum]
MWGYYKLVVIAFLLLTASALANADKITTIEANSGELMKELIATKESCLPSNHACTGPPQECCSKTCVVKNIYKLFVCK